MSNPSSQERRTPSTWTQALRQLELKPSRYKGQNFLHDAAVVRRIVDAARVEPGDRVIEIGPGLGILTAELLDRGAIVTAIELDERLASHLETHLTSPDLRVICADALNVPVEDLYPNETYKVVANLPYSVAAAVVQHFLESGHRPEELVVMVQREVAERIVSRPPDMSILSVAVQFFGEARIVMRVGRGAFIPAPRVDSSVVRITTHQQIPLAGNDIGRFFNVVRAGFGQRRKRLANAIASGINADKATVETVLTRSGIDPGRRAQTLTVAEWVDTYRATADFLAT